MRRRPNAKAVMIDMPRRQALHWAGGALLSIAGVALFARRSAAMTLVEADAQTQALFHAACGPVAYHEKMIADALAALEGRQPGGPRVAQGVIDCPVCGCKLALERGKTERPR